jgi:hypothetical protein
MAIFFIYWRLTNRPIVSIFINITFLSGGKMRRIIITIIAITIFFISGCGDETIIYNTESTLGSIAGYTEPADSGTVTAEGEYSYQGIINRYGFFQILDMEPGIYEVTLYPENYSRYVQHDVIVYQGGQTALRGIDLTNYPYPIRSTYPQDGAENYSPTIRLILYAYEALNVDDLNSGTTITPYVEGYWELTRNYDYNYVSSEHLKVGATYEVTIDASVRTEASVPLGENLHFSFTTVPLEVTVSLPHVTQLGGIPLLGFNPSIRFNDEVYIDSVNAAITFEPPIDGFWLSKYNYDPYTDFFFFATSNHLEPNTSYKMIISDEVILSDGISLPYPDTTEFVTEGYGVNHVLPANGNTNVPPSGYVYLAFSLPMDTASVEAAFSLVELNPDKVGLVSEPIEGIFQWEYKREMWFWPMEDMTLGMVYKIILTTDAQTETGIPIDEEFESYFLVR